MKTSSLPNKDDRKVYGGRALRSVSLFLMTTLLTLSLSGCCLFKKKDPEIPLDAPAPPPCAQTAPCPTPGSGTNYGSAATPSSSSSTVPVIIPSDGGTPPEGSVVQPGTPTSSPESPSASHGPGGVFLPEPTHGEAQPVSTNGTPPMVSGAGYEKKEEPAAHENKSSVFLDPSAPSTDTPATDSLKPDTGKSNAGNSESTVEPIKKEEIPGGYNTYSDTKKPEDSFQPVAQEGEPKSAALEGDSKPTAGSDREPEKTPEKAGDKSAAKLPPIEIPAAEAPSDANVPISPTNRVQFRTVIEP